VLRSIFVLEVGNRKASIIDFKLSPCLNVVCFLLDFSSASVFEMPTFRNILSVPSS
jgi:hypothetical protein